VNWEKVICLAVAGIAAKVQSGGAAIILAQRCQAPSANFPDRLEARR
jgi:hypothetical protein